MKFLTSIVLLSLPLCIAQTAFCTEHVIIQKNKIFSLEKQGKTEPVTNLTVKMGDTIKFVNSEAVDTKMKHNVYSITPGNSFELVQQNPKESSTISMDNSHKPGEMNVECAIHPSMKLHVKIEK